MQNVFQKVSYTLTVEWTEILAPFHCNYFGVRNRGAGTVEIRGDGDGVDVLVCGAQDGLTAPWVGSGTRFRKSECVCGEPQLVTVTFVR